MPEKSGHFSHTALCHSVGSIFKLVLRLEEEAGDGMSRILQFHIGVSSMHLLTVDLFIKNTSEEFNFNLSLAEEGGISLKSVS